jgi:hypothetical protein
MIFSSLCLLPALGFALSVTSSYVPSLALGASVAVAHPVLSPYSRARIAALAVISGPPSLAWQAMILFKPAADSLKTYLCSTATLPSRNTRILSAADQLPSSV